MKILISSTVIALSLLVFSSAHAEDLDLRLLEARDVFREFTEIPETSIPPDFVDKARAVMIFPRTIKGGFIFAARYGTGVVLVRNEAGGWSPPAFMRLSGGSFGLQIGAEWMDLVLIAKNEVALRALLQNRFTLGGALSAVAGPWGRHAEINADWQLRGSMFSYARSRGFFAAVSTEGSVLSFDDEANHAYYGKKLSGPQILFEGKGKLTDSGRKLVEAVDTYARSKK